MTQIGICNIETEEIVWLNYTASANVLDRKRVLVGNFQCSTRNFFKAHRLDVCKTCSKNCQSSLCRKCRYKLGALPYNLQEVTMLVKLSYQPIELKQKTHPLWNEARLQHLLSRKCPRNVAAVLGDCENYRYFYRKSATASTFYAAKIAVYVTSCTLKREKSAGTNLFYEEKFNSVKTKLQNELQDLALLHNTLQLDHSIHFADKDFFAQHNFKRCSQVFINSMLHKLYYDDKIEERQTIIDRQKTNPPLVFCFFDFGENIRQKSSRFLFENCEKMH